MGNSTHWRLPRFRITKDSDGIGLWVDLWDGRYTKYGGFNQWISHFFGIDDLTIGLEADLSLSYWHGWYDGQHHTLRVGPITILWGGIPLLDV